MEKIRLDQFLTRQYPQYTRSRIKKLIEDSFVSIDGEVRTKPSFILRGGEKVEMKRRAPEIPEAIPENIPLHILYEDHDIIVINKAAGMVAHPAPGNFQGTLVNAVLHHLKIFSETVEKTLDARRPTKPDAGVLSCTSRRDEEGNAADGVLSTVSIRPGIVHRLDKGTTGVMVIAKNEHALRELSRQFKSREVEKYYKALVFGKFPKKSGTISLAIGRDTVHRRKFSSKTRKAREAVTHYEVEKQGESLSFLKLKLETGRTHQIRVHLSEMGHPIVGDTLYGAKSFLSMVKNEQVRSQLEIVTRPLLHAAQLSLTHPAQKEKLTFSAPLPDDFKNILEQI